MTTMLRSAVEKARDQFLFYETSHRAKGTPDADAKAEVNKDLAAEMQRALDDAPFDVLSLEKVQDYRFGSLVKGKDYAFARGLTISPAHLPAALDAMLADGFELVCAFGEATSDKMGFLFRRVQQITVTNVINGLELAHGMVEDPYAEIARLRKRVDELLGANNTEVERRRESERKLREFQQGTPLGDIK